MKLWDRKDENMNSERWKNLTIQKNKMTALKMWYREMEKAKMWNGKSKVIGWLKKLNDGKEKGKLWNQKL